MEERKPNAEFDPVWYREYYVDVKEDDAYPLVHYILVGKEENRFQNEDEKNLDTNKTKAIEPFFLEDSYLAANLDIQLACKKEQKKFVGFVDKIENDILYGWVYDENNPFDTISVDIFLNKNKVGTISSSIYRKDLDDAKIGDGKHGFEYKIDNEFLSGLSSVIFEVYVSGKNKNKIGNISYDIISALSIEKKQNLINFFEKYIENVDKLNIKNVNQYIKKDTEIKTITPKRDKLFTSNNDIITPYMEYVYYRYKLDNSFDIEKKVDQKLFLNWYIETYGNIRKGYCIPIRNNIISGFNKEVNLPSSKYPLSHYHLEKLLTTNRTSNLNNIVNNFNTYINEVYNWSYNYCNDIKGIDYLVPEYYQNVLSKINNDLKFKKYPLTHFVAIYHANNTKFHFLDLHQENDRYIYYCLLVLNAFIDKRPDILQYIPIDIFEDILDKDNSNSLERIFNKLFNSNLDYFSRDFIKNIFLQQSYSIDKKVFLTKDNNGNRLESAALSIEDNDILDVQVIGPFEKASGLGQATRLSARVIEKAGFSINKVDFDLDNPAPVGFNNKENISTLKNAKINLIHLNAESVPLVFAYMPDVFEDSYNIGYFYWELDSPAKCHDLALDLLDEVWVSTEYGVQQYKPVTNKPVINVGMTYEKIKSSTYEESRSFLMNSYDINKEDTVFLATFDSFSFIQRKNPLGVLNAFRDAFKDKEEVKLLIKTHNKDFIADPVQLKIWEEIDSIVDSDDRIILINETFQYEDLLKFKKGCDCYISLHRSEGWGFGMIESMNLNLPVIATGYSGNLEFTNDENSWLVDYKEVYLKPDDYIFVLPGQKWAEPSIESASKAMREAYENKDLRKEKAQKGKEYVQEHFNIDVISERYKTRLDEIIEEKLI